MSRGIDRRQIFSDDRDRRHFLDRLADLVERYSVKEHAYVLMGNHYHLLRQARPFDVSSDVAVRT